MPTLHSERRPTDELICELGDQIEIEGVFTDDADLAADPTRVFTAIAAPNGVILIDRYGTPGSGITKASTGVYRRQFVPSTPGRHFWRLWGDGNVTRASVGTIVVLDNPARLTVAGSVLIQTLPAVTLEATGSVV